MLRLIDYQNNQKLQLYLMFTVCHRD